MTTVRPLIFLLLVAIVIAVRLPFVSQPLVGEEGAFAALVSSEVPSSKQTENRLPQMVVGAIGGEPIYYSFQRSIAPYFAIERTAGALVRAVHPVGIDQITIWSRVSYFILFFIGTAILIWRAAAQTSASILLICVMTTPLAVGASIQPQIDGSTSVLVTAIGAVAAIYANRKCSWPLAVFGGTIVATGRPELCLAFAAAAIVLTSLLWLRALPTWLPAAFLVGLAIGTAGSIALSPAEYFLTFATMTRVYGTDTSALRAIARAIPYIWPVWLFGATASVMAIIDFGQFLKNRPDILLILGGSLAITFGFSLSGWSGDGFPRYYISALIGFLICIVEMLIGRQGPRYWGYGCIIISLVGIWFNAAHLIERYKSDVSITSLPGYPLQRMVSEIESSAKRSRETGQIVMEQAALWLYDPKADFISVDFGRAEAVRYLTENRPADLPRLAPIDR